MTSSPSNMPAILSELITCLFSQVSELHGVMGHPVRNEKVSLSEKETQLTATLNLSELTETLTAFIEEDIKEILDGIGDCMVVFTGEMLRLGYSLEELLARAAEPRTFEMVTDDPFYSLDEVAACFAAAYPTYAHVSYRTWEYATRQKLISFVDPAYDSAGLKRELEFLYVDIILGLACLVRGMGVSPIEVSKRIHESNMSKTCKTLEKALATGEAYREKGITPGIRAMNQDTENQYFIVFNQDTGKFLKGPDFQEPILGDLVDAVKAHFHKE